MKHETILRIGTKKEIFLFNFIYLFIYLFFFLKKKGQYINSKLQKPYFYRKNSIIT
jgi:hypothetical protein